MPKRAQEQLAHACLLKLYLLLTYLPLLRYTFLIPPSLDELPYFRALFPYWSIPSGKHAPVYLLQFHSPIYKQRN